MSRRIRVLLWVLVPVIIAIAFAGQAYASRVIEGQPGNFLRTLSQQLIQWYAWTPVVAVATHAGNRWPLGPGTLRKYLPIWISIALAGALVQSALFMTAGHYLHLIPRPAPPEVARLWFGIVVRFQATLATNLLYFAVVALAVHVVLYQREVRERAVRAAQLETRLANAELQTIKAQLQPHFLFNTLHTVSSMMSTDVNGARSVLAALATLLRMSLDDLTHQEVPLARELEFVERYLEIQRARFRDKLEMRMTVDKRLMQEMVPSLLLQPLVENALRHGIEPRRTPGVVSLDARLVQSDNGDRISIVLRNDLEDIAAQQRVHAPGSGMGLSATRARLEQLYGNNFSMSAGESDDQFVVSMELPMRVGKAA